MNLIKQTEKEIVEAVENLSRLNKKLELVKEFTDKYGNTDDIVGYCYMIKNEDNIDALELVAYNEGAQLEFECLGAIFKKPEFNSMSGNFRVNGKLGKHNVYIGNVSKPAGYQIIEVIEECKVYKATCAEGKEL